MGGLYFIRVFGLHFQPLIAGTTKSRMTNSDLCSSHCIMIMNYLVQKEEKEFTLILPDTKEIITFGEHESHW